MYFLELLILFFIALVIFYKLFSQLGIKDDYDEMNQSSNKRIKINAEEISSDTSQDPISNKDLARYTDNIYLYNNIKELTRIIPNFNFAKFFNIIEKVFIFLTSSTKDNSDYIKETIKEEEIYKVLEQLKFYENKELEIEKYNIVNIIKEKNIIKIIFLFQTPNTVKYWHFIKNIQDSKPNWYLVNISDEII